MVNTSANIDAYDYYDPRIFTNGYVDRSLKGHKLEKLYFHHLLQYHHEPINSAQDRGEILKLNSIGLRAPERPDHGAIRICLLGGSFAMGWYAPNAQSTPSYFLEQRLNQRLSAAARVQVINCAQCGKVMWDHLLLLQAIVLQRYYPHIVVCLAGFNDFLTFFADRLPGQARNIATPIIEAMYGVSYLGFFKHVFLRFLRNRHYSLNHFIESYLRIRRNQSGSIRAHSVLARKKRCPMEDYISHFVYMNKLMAAVTHTFGITFISALQPALGYGARKLDKIESEILRSYEVQNIGYQYCLNDFYHRLRIAMREAKSANLLFADLTDTYDNVAERIYVDRAHTGDRGARIIGGKLADCFWPIVETVATKSQIDRAACLGSY